MCRLDDVISRRVFLSLPAAAGLSAFACSRNRGGTGFRGYAFVANEEGQAIAAVDLEVMAVARHIPVSGNPTSIISSPASPFVYVLTKDNGTVHEIAVDRLALARKLTVASAAESFHVSPDGTSLYVLAKEPRSLIRVALDSFQVQWKLPLREAADYFALASDGRTAAISSSTSVRLVDLDSKTLRNPAGSGEFGEVRFLSDAKTLIAADRGERRLSLYDVASSQLITHLPLPVRPDHLCFNADGGQLFVTGEGADAVVVVYPYHTPEVAETVLAGHAPGPMAASQAYLFVASPGSGDVSILQINARKLIAVVAVGSDPGYITVTPDDQYALVLNRQSGDVSVLRVGTITRNRDRRASLLTVIPVGSKPVSAAVRAV
jgi:DNA-binding beta-propeller fold protein YncE